MTNRIPNRGGFTVMELLIVTIIIAVIAAFAIPSYEKAMARQKVKRLILTANLIAGAQEIYKARNGRYWGDPNSPSSRDLNSINLNLGINIVPETNILYQTFALIGQENKFFDVIISDNVLFTFQAGPLPAPPLNIVCTNLSAMPVCP